MKAVGERLQRGADADAAGLGDMGEDEFAAPGDDHSAASLRVTAMRSAIAAVMKRAVIGAPS